MNCKNKYMKSLYSLFVTLLITVVSYGQIQDPVKWNFELGAVVENEVDLILTRFLISIQMLKSLRLTCLFLIALKLPAAR